MTAADVFELRDAILSAVQKEEAIAGERDENGQRYDLSLGQVGTVVEVLAPDVYEVEFTDNEGRAFAELALGADQLLVLHYEPAAA